MRECKNLIIVTKHGLDWDYVGSGPWNTSYIVSVPDCGIAKFSGGVGGGYIDYDDGDHFAN